MWYIHVITSNVNWMFSVITHLICVIYFMVIYLIRAPVTDIYGLKVEFCVVLGLYSLVYIWLTYHTDSNRKTNFLVTYALK
jgi:hypothetical protein